MLVMLLSLPKGGKNIFSEKEEIYKIAGGERINSYKRIYGALETMFTEIFQCEDFNIEYGEYVPTYSKNDETLDLALLKIAQKAWHLMQYIAEESKWLMTIQE